MATQLEEREIDEIEPVEEEPVDQNAEAQGDDASGEGEEPVEGEEEDEITFGGNAVGSGEPESEGLKNLREAWKREKKRADDLEAKVAPQVVDLGPEPDIDEYWEHDDPKEAWKRDWQAWNGRKQERENAVARQRQAAEAAQRELQDAERAFEAAGTSLRVKDYAPARDSVLERLTAEQRVMFLGASEKPAALVYALSKQPDKLEELLKIDNPIKFTAAITRLDMGVTVNTRKPTTSPEQVHRGAGGAGRGDRTLERLEAKAAQTGDRTELIAYRRKLREREGK